MTKTGDAGRRLRLFDWTEEELSDEGRLLELEWLEADGLGGFASGTVSGARTRRQHGWYAPAIPPPRRRWMLVAGAEEVVSHADGVSTISRHIRADADPARADAPLVRFAMDPFPRWLFRAPRFWIERSLCLVRDRSITIVRYINRGHSEVGLRVRPLLRFRAAHELQTESAEIDPATEVRGEVSWVRPVPYLPRLYMRGVGASTRAEPVWYRDFLYPRDAESGEEGREDLWSPIVWDWSLPAGARGYILLSREEVAGDPAHLLEAETRRRDVFPRTGDPAMDELGRRSELFLADGDDRASWVLSGYPDLADGGRDGPIAAPGLAVATGRYAAAARALNGLATTRRDGLLPGRFAPDETEAEYDSIDAPLWFVIAVEWFARARQNPSRPAPLLGTVRSILSAFREGTRFGIRAGADGLLGGGASGHALTWMDAVVDGLPVTPRPGRPVEVNALWHAALKSAARLERLASESVRARELEAEAWHVARRFNEAFWNSGRQCLYDRIDDEGPDPSVRPNQIFAVALSDDLLPPHRARAVYWTVRRSLFTPFGLRTLDPRDPRYRGRAGPSERERALAMHQGAAWPWLLGAFVDAHGRVFGRDGDFRRTLDGWMEPLREHLRDAGIGCVSQMFDGDPPHSPRGSVAHASSAAEVLRIVHRYLGGSA
jgi:predicted glycogen debranching enzyme